MEATTTSLLMPAVKLAIIIVTLTTATLSAQMDNWNPYGRLTDAYDPIASELYAGKNYYGTDPIYRNLMRNMIMLDEDDYDKRDMPGVLRFGKREGDNIPGVLRFGKRYDDIPGVLRFGKRSASDALRFGHR